MSLDKKPSLDDVVRNTKISDITDAGAWLEEAKRHVSVAYGQLVNPKMRLSTEEIYAAVSDDAYEKARRSRTVATLTTDPKCSTAEISGLVRVVFGGGSAADNPGLRPLDAMNFVEPVDGWPHRRAGLEDAKAAELGRFIIVEKFRTGAMRRAGIHAFLTRCLFTGSIAVTRERGIKALYAIMPSYMSGLSIKAGVNIREIESRLRTEDEEASRIFEQFSIYWKRSSPRLYQFMDAAAE